MPEVLPAHAILSAVTSLAELANDAPMESLCLAFVHLLQEPALQRDEELFAQLVLLGAGLWRHTDEFKAGGSETVQ